MRLIKFCACCHHNDQRQKKIIRPTTVWFGKICMHFLLYVNQKVINKMTEKKRIVSSHRLLNKLYKTERYAVYACVLYCKMYRYNNKPASLAITSKMRNK